MVIECPDPADFLEVLAGLDAREGGRAARGHRRRRRSA
jgi:hypothetical protein